MSGQCRLQARLGRSTRLDETVNGVVKTDDSVRVRQDDAMGGRCPQSRWSALCTSQAVSDDGFHVVAPARFLAAAVRCRFTTELRWSAVSQSKKVLAAACRSSASVRRRWGRWSLLFRVPVPGWADDCEALRRDRGRLRNHRRGAECSTPATFSFC
jgi:hypothetical protein